MSGEKKKERRSAEQWLVPPSDTSKAQLRGVMCGMMCVRTEARDAIHGCSVVILTAGGGFQAAAGNFHMADLIHILLNVHEKRLKRREKKKVCFRAPHSPAMQQISPDIPQ